VEIKTKKNRIKIWERNEEKGGGGWGIKIQEAKTFYIAEPVKCVVIFYAMQTDWKLCLMTTSTARGAVS
jgi:hypothetical protein